MVIIKQNMDDSVLAVMIFCCYRRYQNVIKKKKLARVNGDDEHKKWNGFKTASSFRGAK